jgi:hypothetical protein
LWPEGVYITPFGHYYKQKMTFLIIGNSMYINYVIDHIHLFLNESKKMFFYL